MKINCPKCNQEYSIDESYFGKTVQCQQCSYEFMIVPSEVSIPLDSKQEIKKRSFNYRKSIFPLVIITILLISSVYGFHIYKIKSLHAPASTPTLPLSGCKSEDLNPILKIKIAERLSIPEAYKIFEERLKESKALLDETKKDFPDRKDFWKDAQELVDSNQKILDFRNKIKNETGNQTKKATFLLVHAEYIALSPEARKQFIIMINDKSIIESKKDIKTEFIMKYPLLLEEMERKEYEERVMAIIKELGVTLYLGTIDYDTPAVLDAAYKKAMTNY